MIVNRDMIPVKNHNTVVIEELIGMPSSNVAATYYSMNSNDTNFLLNYVDNATNHDGRVLVRFKDEDGPDTITGMEYGPGKYMRVDKLTINGVSAIMDIIGKWDPSVNKARRNSHDKN